MCIAYDPFKWADNYESSFEQLLGSGQLDWEGVKEFYIEGLITTDELEYAEDYFDNN